MSTNQVLKGGLGSSSSNNDGNGFAKAAKASADRRVAEAREMGDLNLEGIDLFKPDEVTDELVRIARELDGYAKKAFMTVVQNQARARDIEKTLGELGETEGRRLQEKVDAWRVTLARLQSYGADDNADVRRYIGELDEEGDLPEDEKRRRVEEATDACRRVRTMTRLALLVDKILSAEDKDGLESVVHNAREGEGEHVSRVFVSRDNGPVRLFGRTFDVDAGVFSDFGYRSFAVEQLVDAVKNRSHELAAEHKAEVEKRESKISADDDDRVSAEELLFGDPEDTAEKAAALSWVFRKGEKEFKNSILLRRRDKALVIEEVVGAAEKDFCALNELGDEYGIKGVAVMLFNIVKGDQLIARNADGRYVFDIRVPARIPTRTDDSKQWWNHMLGLTLWVRTAAGASVSQERLPEGERGQRPAERPVNGNGGDRVERQPRKLLPDNDGSEAVDLPTFFFKKHGTVEVTLPAETSKLHFGEVKDESQAVIAAEAEIQLTKPATLRFQRSVKAGVMRTKAELVSCGDEEVAKRFGISGILGVAWQEQGNKFVGLPDPLPQILAFLWKRGCEEGKIVVEKRPENRR